MICPKARSFDTIQLIIDASIDALLKSNDSVRPTSGAFTADVPLKVGNRWRRQRVELHGCKQLHPALLANFMYMHLLVVKLQD